MTVHDSALAVEARAVTKRFVTRDGTVDALDRVDVAVGPGEFVCLVGPSGCGKSTLLNIIAGLIAPTAGEVLIDGRTVVGPPAEVGVMFQSAVLLEWRTVRANVLLPIELRDGRKAAERMRATADELLAMAGLAGFEARYPSELSGGMQQRVAICRMLIARPDVLLLDEPFGALDELTREHMNVELASICARAAAAAVFVTHNIQEAVFLSDRVYVMSARPGRVVGAVDVDLERARDLDIVTTPAFQALVRQVRTLLNVGADGLGIRRASRREAVG
ncbi:MAG: ABC transporter ATP-binding protein [Acidimicrobiales bacterium]